jgi:hypothetical protein
MEDTSAGRFTDLIQPLRLIVFSPVRPTTLDRKAALATKLRCAFLGFGRNHLGEHAQCPKCIGTARKEVSCFIADSYEYDITFARTDRRGRLEMV